MHLDLMGLSGYGEGTFGAHVPPASRRRYVFLALLFVAFLFACMLVPVLGAPAYAVEYDGEELAFLELINDYRAEHGRGPVELSDQLSLTAERHATDMAKYEYFSHTTQQSDFYPAGYHSWDRMKADGYTAAHTTGENLAAGMAEADRALEAWIGSQSHNENMLDPGEGSARSTWRAIGIARVQNSETGVWYWVTDFGTEVQAATVAAGTSADSGGSQSSSAGSQSDPALARAEARGVSYENSVRRLANMNIFEGYTSGSFGLGDPVLRQQFAKLIVKTVGLTPTEADVSPFPDVDVSGAEHLYPDNYVAFAHERGITKGGANGRFNPWGTISRAQAVTMVVRAAQTEAPGLLTQPPNSYSSAWGSFSDAHASNAAMAEYSGLLDGLPVASLDPWAPMPRGEVAQILDNMTR